jgi:hypothetical protein
VGEAMPAIENPTYEGSAATAQANQATEGTRQSKRLNNYIAPKAGRQPRPAARAFAFGQILWAATRTCSPEFLLEFLYKGHQRLTQLHIQSVVTPSLIA